MFVGTSILNGFSKGFERVLGGQNLRFSHFFRCFFHVIFEVRFGKAKKTRKKCENQFCSTSWGRPGGMCVARGRDREGVVRRSRPRLLKLSNLGLKIFGQGLDLEFSTRRHLRWAGGALRAIRRAVSRWPVELYKY